MRSRGALNGAAGEPRRPAALLEAGETDWSVPGLRIQAAPSDAPWDITVRSSESLDGWHADPAGFAPGAGGSLPVAILYRGRAYRVKEAQRGDGGWLYRLRIWPSGEPWGRSVRLEGEAMARERRDRLEFERMNRLEPLAPWYEFLLGFLPARMQLRLAERLHFSPADATRKNGFLAFVLGFAFSALGVVTGAGYQSPGALGAAAVALYLAVEGLVRWQHGLHREEPLGLLALELADRLLFSARARRGE